MTHLKSILYTIITVIVIIASLLLLPIAIVLIGGLALYFVIRVLLWKPEEGSEF